MNNSPRIYLNSASLAVHRNPKCKRGTIAANARDPSSRDAWRGIVARLRGNSPSLTRRVTIAAQRPAEVSGGDPPWRVSKTDFVPLVLRMT